MAGRLTDDEVRALYAELGPVLFRRCLSLLRDPEAAKDATQEVFLRLLECPERLRDPTSALPLIFRSASNYCLNQLRDASRHERSLRDLGAVQSAHDTSFFPDRRLADRVLSRFDARTRSVAVAVLLDGMQLTEAAAVLGLSRKTVARKLNRFLADARKYLARSTV